MSVLFNLLECAKLLIKAGADVNFIIPFGTTPLSHAAYDGLTDFINILLEAGADPNAVDKSGKRPIEVAAMSAKRNAVEILFHVTSPIPYIPDWSVDGIISYVSSKRLMQQVVKELSRGRLFAEMKSKACYREGAAHSLLKDYAGAADAFLEGLTLDPGNEEIEKALCEAVESMKKLHCSDKKQ